MVAAPFPTKGFGSKQIIHFATNKSVLLLEIDRERKGAGFAGFIISSRRLSALAKLGPHKSIIPGFGGCVHLIDLDQIELK